MGKRASSLRQGRSSLPGYVGADSLLFRNVLHLPILIIFALASFSILSWRQAGPSDSAEGELSAQVAELVEQLDAPQRSVRDAAERKLETLGWKVLPELARIVPRSPEVQLRLERLRERLIAHRIRGESAESRVTLERDEVSVEELLRAIEAQTGNRVSAGGALGEKRLSVNYHGEAFWKVIDDVTSKLGATVVSRKEGTLELVESSEGRLPLLSGQVSYLGPFRVSLGRTVREKPEIAPGFVRSDERGMVSVVVMWEPRLRPAILWWGPVEVVYADDGQSEFISPGRREIPLVDSRCAMEIASPLTPGLRERKSRRIRGFFEPVLPMLTEVFLFDKPEVQRLPIKRQLGDVTVSLTTWREVGQQLDVGLRAEYANPEGAFGSHRGWFYTWTAEVMGEGYQKKFDQLEAIWLGDNGVELIYRFRGLRGNVLGIRWAVPLAIAKLSFQFELPVEVQNAGP